MKLNILKLISLFTILSALNANSTFNILDSYPQCDNPIRIGVCRNYIIYGLVDAASLFFCIKAQIKSTDYLSVQNQLNLAQNQVIFLKILINSLTPQILQQMCVFTLYLLN